MAGRCGPSKPPATPGYPLDAGAVLLIELEGLAEQVEEQAEAVREVCLQQRAREVRRAKDENERALLWKGRKNAFAALGRLAPAYYSQDGVVPRTQIPAVLQFIEGVAKKYGLRIGNIFHAGDGNLHPLILFDPRDPDAVGISARGRPRHSGILRIGRRIDYRRAWRGAGEA